MVTAMTRSAMVVALAAGLGLAACTTTNSIRITNVYQELPYSKSLVQYTAAPGEVTVQIHGKAFAGQLPGDDEAIAEKLRMPAWVAPARFTTLPSDVARRSQRIVLAFNPAARGPVSYRLCDDPETVEYAPVGARTRLEAAFCSGGRMVANAIGETAALSGVDDPQLAVLTRQLMVNLLPFRNPFKPNPACPDGAC